MSRTTTSTEATPAAKRSKTAAEVAPWDDAEVGLVYMKIGGTLSTGYLYQDALNVVAQLDGSGNLVARYVFSSKANVPDYYTTSAGTFRILSDHLGSPRLVVNTSTGAVVEEIDYDEFGNVTNDTAPGTIPFGYAGGLYDRDTGLVRFGARDYDASVGRWTTKDPIRFGGGTNLYRYSDNDPIDFRDPKGRATYDCIVPLQSLGFVPPYTNLYHEYTCVTQGQNIICGSFNPSGSKFGSPGVTDPNDTYDPTVCKQVAPDNTCIEDCVATIVESPNSYPWYKMGPGGYQCQDFSKDVEGYCKAACQ